jgi:alanyl-tRNA synthetase
VGPIAIRKWERRGQTTRVEFVCGWRAVRDHRWKTAAINELALAFSVKDKELPSAVQRLMQEAEENRRELSRLKSERLVAEANQLLTEAIAWHDVRVVVRVFEDRDAQEVRNLALLLAKGYKTVALLGTGGQRARLFFARSDDVSVDMAALLKKTCLTFGGSGGGQPHLAQGGGLRGDQVGEALLLASQSLRNEG